MTITNDAAPRAAAQDERPPAPQGPAMALADFVDATLEERFDRLTALAAQVFDAPVAFISLSGAGKVWSQSRIDRDQGFDASALARFAESLSHSDIVVISDVTAPRRGRSRRHATPPPYLRAYAAAPLIGESGWRLGVVGVVDRRRRRLSRGHRRNLEHIAALTADAIDDCLRRRELEIETADARRAEVELRRSREQLALAIEGGGLGLWDWCALSNRVQYSERWAEMVGYRKDELAEDFSTWERLVHPDDLEYTKEKVAKYLSGALPAYDVEFRMRHKEGGWRWIASRGKIFERDAEGNPSRIVGAHLDITGRKHIESRIKQKNEYLQIAETIADLGHWWVDVQKNIVFWSPGIYRIHGVDPERYTPELTSAIDFYHPDDRDDVHMVVADAIEHQQSFEFERRIVRPNGEIRYVHSKGECHASSETGSVMIFGVLQDITDRKTVDKFKDDLISTVNHELRTPLTSVMAGLENLRRNCGSCLNREARRVVDVSHKNGLRLKRLVDDFINMEQIYSGLIEYKVNTVLICNFVRSVVDRSDLYMKKRDVTCVLNITAREDVTCDVDESRLDQALANLLSNAAKFSPKGGEVVVTVACPDPQRVRIAVTDQGPGIPDEFHGRIFSRFAQADGSASRAAEGSGLGLYITKSIVEASGGGVCFDSVEGGGATFLVDLPVSGASLSTCSNRTEDAAP